MSESWMQSWAKSRQPKEIISNQFGRECASTNKLFVLVKNCKNRNVFQHNIMTDVIVRCIDDEIKHPTHLHIYTIYLLRPYKSHASKIFQNKIIVANVIPLFKSNEKHGVTHNRYATIVTITIIILKKHTHITWLVCTRTGYVDFFQMSCKLIN